MNNPPALHWGFTGTRLGMTGPQKEIFREHIRIIKPEFFHHGDCIGSDAHSHDIVRELLPNCVIIIHPPTDSRLRAFCRGDIFRPAYPYLIRNRQIVTESDGMIAVSNNPYIQHNGGTWSTVKFTLKMCKPINIIKPDGSLFQLDEIDPLYDI